ncbi:MAG: polyprenyl synthetase family protein [Actinomycetales bacterium]|nr:polyprenyl synthetase family protein [Actinomycetales bacterium]
MSETTTLLDLIQQRLDEFCAQQRRDFAAISDELAPITDYVQDLLQGGKRFRALFAYWAWVGALENQRLTPEQLELSAEAIVEISAALEMFHGAALVHDDLLDRSDTRRGKPAVHKRFENLHSQSGWAGAAERFGQAGSVLVGDMMLGWANELFAKAILKAPSAAAQQAAREQFHLMQIEVMAGQYLDVAEENAGPTRAAHEAVGRANRVMLYKTAKYSVEAPLLIGAAFAGGDEALLHSISAFAVPLGLAFQLKDDILGVFGAPEKTGKPVGDDLREGKRTVLIALTRETLAPTVVKIFDELLTERDLSDDQIRYLQQTIVDSGALRKTELMLEELADQSLAALEHIELAPNAKSQLRALAQKVISRDS